MSKLDWVYGIHTVKALLKLSPETMVSLWIQQGRVDTRVKSLISEAHHLGIGVEYVKKETLTARVGPYHQGVAARVHMPKVQDEQTLIRFVESIITARSHQLLLLILEHIQDPHNLGACLRSANAAGVDAVIIPAQHSVSLTPTVCKVASGAAHLVPFFQVPNIARCLTMLQSLGVWVVGMTVDAPDTLYSLDLTGHTALVLGNEHTGLRPLTQKTCDQSGVIPMYGHIASLNISVASALSCFEAVRQRQNAKKS